MANKDNKCDFCETDNWDENDNLCKGCRQAFGPNAEASSLPGIKGALDIGMKGLLRDSLKVVQGWKEAMGEPMICEISVPPMPKHGSPGLEIYMKIRFIDPEGKHTTKDTK